MEYRSGMRRLRGRRPVLLIALIGLFLGVGLILLLNDGSDRADPHDSVALERLAGDIVVRLPDDPRVDQITRSRLEELTRGDIVEGAPHENELAVLRSEPLSNDGRPLWHYAVWTAMLCAVAGFVFFVAKLRSRQP
jgi:hypothetical protein